MFLQIGFDYNKGLNVVDAYDFLIGVLYFVVIYAGFNFYKNRTYSKNKQISNYFKYGILCKLFAAFLYVLYHQFILGSGDTFFYYLDSRYIAEYCNWNLFDMATYLKPYTITSEYEIFYEVKWVYNLDNFMYNASLLFVIKVSMILNYFSLNSYTATSLLFGTLTFLSTWQIFKTLVKYFGKYHKILAISFLFFPSVLFWANGVSKDSISFSMVCLIFVSILNIIHFKRKIALNAALLIVYTYVIITVKGYILASMIPGLLLMIYLSLNKSISNNVTRKILAPLILVIVIVGTIFLSNNLYLFDVRFTGSTKNLATAATNQQNYLQYAGSAYNLGIATDNFFILFPLSIIVTLFRPFAWEISNISMILAFFESLLVSILSYFVFVKFGIKNSIRKIFTNQFLAFSFTFTIVLGIIVGSSSGNFGTLIRYKMPCIPFFISNLLILFVNYNENYPLKKMSLLRKFIMKHIV